MLAHIRRVFRRVFRRDFAGQVGPFTSSFFGRVFGRVGPIYVGFWLGYRGFWAGFSWFFFWAVNVAGKEEVAEVAVTSLLFSRFASFLCGLGTPSCQCT